MKQIAILLLLSITLFFLFVFCGDKSTNPPNRDDPGYYYPRQPDYGWRYFHEGWGLPSDTFDLKIVGRSVRHGNVGFDRLWVGRDDTIFIYLRSDTLFEENAGTGTPLFKILVGPIKTGTSWRDIHFYYQILEFEDVTLTINGETYKRCAKIMKTPRNPTPSKPDRIYEWWAPEYGEVKEMEVDTGDAIRYLKELLYFSKTGVFP